MREEKGGNKQIKKGRVEGRGKEWEEGEGNCSCTFPYKLTGICLLKLEVYVYNC